MVDWVLNKSIQKSFEAFKKGFWTVMSGNAIGLFHPDEIERLLCGSSEVSELFFPFNAFIHE
jgi:E3 ubiquitin-protein ligase HECTD2